MAIMRHVCWLLAVFFAAGCGSTGGAGAGGGGAATGGGTSAAGGGATGGSGGGSAAAGGGSASSGPLKTGSVILTQSCVTAGPTTVCSGSAVAVFATVTPLGEVGCTDSTTAGCKVHECSSDGGVTFTTTVDAAGDLSVTGSQVDGGIALHPTPGSGYPAFITSRMWSGGETLTLSATGGTVPAFSGQAVVTPTAVSVSAPDCGIGSCGPASRASAYVISFTGGGPDVIAKFTSTSARRSVTMTCPLSSSPAAVPAEAMGRLGATADGFINTLYVSAAASKDFAVGPYSVTFAAQQPGTSGGLDVTN